MKDIRKSGILPDFRSDSRRPLHRPDEAADSTFVN